MGLFGKIWEKMNQGFFYIVDIETLKKHLEKDLNFSIEHNLEASANLNLYLGGSKHHIQIWNYSASSFKDDQEKGLIIYYDEEEYRTLDELYNARLNNMPNYFKIELIDGDDVFLNKYKEEHPELKVEDYK